ncbi:hypothetical protein E4U42_001724 [Claviceps africana]|uniref:Phospholipase/carboxylesterase/thioesterase domain-containing protein n=1 Tax=Claviceps africana TaxID=83212 RepID=A0A8K0J9K8_9HYPO|nr:hypothetical protein E4U42_001724 [Claviceps africana]
MASSSRTPKGQFPPPIIVPPLQQPHRHTIIFLHGRGSNAAKFHGPLLETVLDDNQTFRDAFPTARFVFPSAPMSRATKYARMLIHQWFDGSGDWELAAARGGMRPTMDYIGRLIRQEIHILGGNARRVVLAGLSQGCAAALMSILLWEGGPLGAVVGLCGYVPICSHLLGVFDGAFEPGHADGDDDGGEYDVFERDENPSPPSPAQRVLDALRDEAELSGDVAEPCRVESAASTPVFLGHGTLDPQVPVSQALLAEELLRKMGMAVELHTYEGLGHWYAREMLCHVVSFLQRHLCV